MLEDSTGFKLHQSGWNSFPHMTGSWLGCHLPLLQNGHLLPQPKCAAAHMEKPNVFSRDIIFSTDKTNIELFATIKRSMFGGVKWKLSNHRKLLNTIVAALYCRGFTLPPIQVDCEK
ncbi:hypothetical protein ILYODFUR_012748 [Ilyodon furcidens]|uniref:DDE Tnp4 domain-containing protein n=1 Tax=Ilyodon furcidens TaxID=33524 RepID=A0ABV0TAD3_9TELE